MTEQNANFHLRCVKGHPDVRPAEACRGEDPPMCKVCFMPMFLEEVRIGGEE